MNDTGFIRKVFCKYCNTFVNMNFKEVGSKEKKNHSMTIFIHTCTNCKDEDTHEMNVFDWIDLKKGKYEYYNIR